MATNPLDLDELARLSSLDDPLRRRLYEYVAEHDAPVSREQAATATGAGRTLAAYHLDKLADAGLLATTYQRPAGRGGPGAGRPAKLYTRAERELAVTVPPRDYELLARLLVKAAEQDGSGVVRAAVGDAAHEAGRQSAPEADGDIVAALRECGYQPCAGEEGIELRNCPFHRLAQEHRDLVCGLNLRLVEGVLARTGANAVLDPRPGRCCVVVHQD